MTRIQLPVSEPTKYQGIIITKEMFQGRGYCHIQNGKVIDDSFPHLKELTWEEDKEEDESIDDITCKKAKRYIVENTDNSSGDSVEYWMKGIPVESCEQEIYLLTFIDVKPVSRGYKIMNIRVVVKFGYISFPGSDSIDSNFYSLEMLPPEVVKEVEMLIGGRYIPNGFTLIGKPMPQNKEIFHPNPPYSLACNSGWRNVYWHLSIKVDDNNYIQNLNYSTYVREVSICQRPQSMSDDMAEAFEAALMIVDQYTDEEWQTIKGV